MATLLTTWGRPTVADDMMVGCRHDARRAWQPGAARRTGLASAVCVAIGLLGCDAAGGESNPSVSSGAVAGLTEAEIFHREQEAVRICMEEAGFEYTAITPVELGDQSMYRFAMLVDAKTRGYGALRNHLHNYLGSMGEPDEELSREEEAKYYKALVGDVNGDHDHVGEEGSGDVDTDSALEAVGDDLGELFGGGCQAVGYELRVELESARRDGEVGVYDTLETDEEFFLELGRAPWYPDFVASWQECMTRSGLRVPAEPWLAWNDHMELISGPVADAFGDEAQLEERFGDLVNPAVIDAGWMRKVLDRSPDLARLYDEEVAVATVDAACRYEAYEPFAAEFDALSEQIYGLPFELS